MSEDKALVYKVLNGDIGAYEILVKQYERLVWHMVSRVLNKQEDIEDLCQEVFIKIYRNLKKFKFDSKLSTWIATIAYREALNYKRRHKFPDNQEVESVVIADHISPETLSSKNSVVELVHKIIEKLPQHYRTILTLYHLEEFNYKEIEEITGMPEGTVKNYLFRARKLMKEAIEQHDLKKELLD